MFGLQQQDQSSVTYASPSHLSNGSIQQGSPISAAATEDGISPDVLSLMSLSLCLEKILVDNKFDYTDAEFEVDGTIVGVHRCILASRTDFFHDLFSSAAATLSWSKEEGEGKGKGKEKEKEKEKPRYSLRKIIPRGYVGLEAFNYILRYLYTGKLNPPDPSVSRCVDLGCPHDVCRPTICFHIELMYASYSFKLDNLVLLLQCHLANFIEKAYVEDIYPILLVAFHCNLIDLLYQCMDLVARSDVDDNSIQKEFPMEISEKIKCLRLQSHQPLTVTTLQLQQGRIYKALDSDDVELVKMLLNESTITLDDVNALHYASAYCDPKVVTEVLELGVVDVNLKNSRGYTPLHIASMRRDPGVIMSLLRKSASSSESTNDGRTSLDICRRLIRQKDYNARMEQGKESNKDQICINLLEEAAKKYIPTSIATREESVSSSSPATINDLQAKLLYLENRVALAKLFYPTQAKLAMQIAETEFKHTVDLNETPEMRKKRLDLRKIKALSKTVELGKKYFPHCSEVLNRFMEDDIIDTNSFINDDDTLGEQSIKRKRYHEIKEDVLKAFSKDKKHNRRTK
ncbi:NPR1-1 protein [Zostera marina]|uniref:NPR1-1 protein n=1 Tax=Zostera marina TaxID=29655 RepID=A0A0K9Q6A3_ZOSMR|nr:NPR1-1 protein [Zostera marina]